MGTSTEQRHPLSRSSVQWLITVVVLLLVASASWFYLLYTRVELDRKIAEADRAVAAESQRAPFSTLESYDAAERRADLMLRRESLSGTFPLKALFETYGTAQPPTEAARRAHEITMEFRGRAEVAEAAAAEAQFKDMDLNVEAIRMIGEWRQQLEKEKLAAAG